MSLERFTRKRVATIGPEANVGRAAERMEREHVGALVVVDGDRPVGIVTDRDLALRALGHGHGPELSVGDVMTGDPVCIGVGAQIDDALATIRRAGVRRLPIVDRNGALVGLVSLDDVLVLLSGELSTGIGAVLEDRGP